MQQHAGDKKASGSMAHERMVPPEARAAGKRIYVRALQGSLELAQLFNNQGYVGAEKVYS
jgi:hypothetical protein